MQSRDHEIRQEVRESKNENFGIQRKEIKAFLVSTHGKTSTCPKIFINFNLQGKQTRFECRRVSLIPELRVCLELSRMQIDQDLILPAPEPFGGENLSELPE